MGPPAAAGRAQHGKSRSAQALGVRRQQNSSNKAKTRGLTSFEARLYKACQCIPKGKVATYGMLASVLDSCARAVGQGMRRNKFAPVVPCHRVVASDLSLGGFCGAWGEDTDDVKRKRKMLLEEGVRLDGNQVQRTSLVDEGELLGLIKQTPDFDAAAAAKLLNS